MDSLLGWWQDSGVNAVLTAEPVPWLRPGHPAPTEVAAAAIDTASAVPTDLASFMALLKSTDGPEHGWPGAFVPPSIVEGAALLIISDMPDAEAMAGEALNSPYAALLGAMLRAIGLDRETVSFASLATRRPIGGLIDDACLTVLGDRCRQLITLSAPRALLLLGDQTARALGVTSNEPAVGPLRSVNHVAGTISALALPNLMLLAQKPRLKARSWLALRHLKEMTA